MTQRKQLADVSPEDKRKILRKLLARHQGGAAETAGGSEVSVGAHPLGNGTSAPLYPDIPKSFYQFPQLPEYQQLHLFHNVADHADVSVPYFKVHEGLAGDTTRVGGRELINFASYNYLGLNGHPRVVEAAKAAMDRYGISASASRLVAGERPIHRDLEQELADLHGVENAVVFVSGHATNVSAIGTLFGPHDLVMHDRLIHNSVIQGIQLSGAVRRVFAHNDWRAVDAFLTEQRHNFEKVLIVVEGLYGMDGDPCPLPELLEVKRRHKAFLMIDEAHSIGVLGRHGRGVGEHFGVDGNDVDIWMGTLSKTLSACGGYIAGCNALVELLKYKASGFVYSVGIPPAIAASARESLRIMLEEPERVARLQESGRLFLELAQAKGLDVGRSQGHAITSIITRGSLPAVQLSNRLFERGINALPIIYPAVEEKTARLRFFLTSRHDEDQIRRAVDAIADEWARLEPRA